MNQPPITLMNTDKEEPLYKEESDLLIGSAIAVHNGIGHGFHEKPYENGLVVELRFRAIPYEQQRRSLVICLDYSIHFKHEKLQCKPVVI